MLKNIRAYIFIIVFVFSSIHAQVKNNNWEVLSSGIKRKLIVHSTSGEAVRPSWQLTLRFIMTTDSGQVIDKTMDKEYRFIVNEREGLIGWDLCLLSLQVGDSANFIIPSALAYGDKKVGKIKPGSQILFCVKVIKQEQVYYDNGLISDTILIQKGIKKILNKSSSGPLASNYNYLCIKFTGYIKTKEGHRRIFESSSKSNQRSCYQLGVGKFIKGLDIALSNAHIGEKSTIVIAPEWGYGDKEKGIIPANSVLYYDVELIEESSPFLYLNSNDTLAGDNGVKILCDFGARTDTFGIEKVMKCDMVLYFLDNKGGKVIFSDNKWVGNQIHLPYNSKVLSPLIVQNLHFFSAGDKGLLIIPANKCEEWVLKRGVPVGKDVMVQVSNISFINYPYYNSIKIEKTNLKDGVYYYLIRSGKRDSCSLKAGDEINFVYTGYYIKNGQRFVFNTSRETAQALTYVVGEKKLIPGLICGIEGMHINECRKIYIPYSQGYGENGVEGAGIPPRTDLYFDVEVINIKHK